MKQESDSIYITADTLFSARLSDRFKKIDSATKKLVITKPKTGKAANDSTDRYFEAFRHVRIFSDSVQAVSDSLFYSYKDSVFRLFQKPVVWGNKSQITGDTIYLHTRRKKADRIEVFENSFLVNSVDPGVYNQIRSTRMDGWFREGILDSLRARGATETVYFLRNEDSAYTGANQTTSDLMDAYFRLGESQSAPAALGTYRAALASAQAFEQNHPGLRAASEFVARAAIRAGTFALNDNPKEAMDVFSQARSRLDALAETETVDYFAALQGMGRAQFRRRDLLASLASFSRALQIAEGQFGRTPSVSSRRNLAASNFWVGAVLAQNGENEAAAAKLRKAFELYRDLASAQVTSAEDSPAGYRKALADVAAQAPSDLRQGIDTELHESTAD